MDQAWQLEEDFWQAGCEGRVKDHYARILATDAFVVVPGHTLLREDLLRQWDDRAAWRSYRISERKNVLVNGETVVLSYRVEAEQADGPTYCARVSSVYTWVTGWVLAFRQHTPDPGLAMDPVVVSPVPSGPSGPSGQ